MKPESSTDIVHAVDIGTWSMSDERAFMENLFVGRFNSFLLVFSLFVTAGFANNFVGLKSVVFFAGAGVLLIVWLSLHRAYLKYDRIVKLLLLKRDHPMSQTQRILELEGFSSGFRASWVMGVGTPALCVALLVAAGLATQFGLFNGAA